MLTVAVLGPLEVRRDGRLLQVPAGKATEVLIRLALDAGRSVTDERLIDDLWGDAAAETVRNTLQSKVSQLRRGLGGAAYVARRGGGYTLELDAFPVDAVDAVHVAEAAAAASRLRRAGDGEGVLTVTAEALSRFRGEPLVDAGDGEWLHPHRTRLAEVRLGLLEDRMAARVDLQAGGDVIGELESLVEHHPLREGLWVSLVTALYRAGRQAEALAAHARIRRALADDLGLDPGPELRALELQILQQAATLELPVPPVPAPAPDPAPLAGPLRRGNLPALAAPLVGRLGELAQLDRLVGAERLVTLVGPAGVGKTRLATEVARRAPATGGAWIVRLDGTDPGAVAQSVAETLQVAGGELMPPASLAGRDLLVVLDNCEHVAEEVADLAGRLLDATAALRLLATSQRPLGVDGEVVVPVAPLALAESVELFATRATAVRAQFVLDERSADTVEVICRSLDGLPLAIELAAARVKSLSVAEISRRLEDRFSLLQDPTSRRPPRRRGLASALAWAYDLLFPDDQRGLWALACFADGAPLPAAEDVVSALGIPRSSAVDVFARLVDRSLVTVEEVAELGGTVRYRLLDTIRSFAAERLEEAGLGPVARAAHASWVAATSDWAAATVRGPGQRDCLAVARCERANIDAALAWAAEQDPDLGVRIANGFGWTWAVLGDGGPGAARVREALAARRAAGADDRAAAAERRRGLLLASWLEAAAGDVERAASDLAQAGRLTDELADTADHASARADVLRHLAFVRIQQGRPAEARDAAEASIERYRRLDLAWETAASANLAAFALAALGDTARAAEAAAEALEIRTSLGDDWGTLHSEAVLGGIALAEGRLDEAAGRLGRAAAGAAELGFPAQAALHLSNLGRVQWRAGDAEAAVDTLRRAIRSATDCGDGRVVAASRLTLARVLRAIGRDDAAVVELRSAARWYGESGGGDGALLTRTLLVAASAPGDPGSAVAALEGVRAEARRCGDLDAEVHALDALALLAAEGGGQVAARRLLGEAETLVANARHLVHEGDRVDARRVRQVLESAGATAPSAR